MLDVSLGDLSGKDLTARRQILLEEAPDVLAWADSLKACHMMCDTTMTTPDGRKLHAWYMYAPEKTDRTMMVLHGYTCNIFSSLKISRMFRDSLGLNLFLPDLHAHGESDGQTVQMGWKDADDMLGWIPVIQQLFGDSLPPRIAIQGVSMGASTAMNISGREHLDAIKCYIEDCGFTSVWDEFTHELQVRYGLPEFPLMLTTSALCKLLYGWSFGEASSVEMVKRCHKPILFIHGDDDDFVPTSMVNTLYEAKEDNKTLWITRGTDHAHSFRNYPDEYQRRVRKLLTDCGM